MYRVLKLKESENKEFRYITTHGIGPGTVPDGVFIRSEDLENGKTAIYLNRPLTDEELKKYDIKPEWIQESLAEADDEEEDLEDVKDNIEAAEELEDTVDSEEDQEENPVEEESILDTQLDELRDILVDLDLNLYRIASKEDPNNVIYIIGKVAEDSNDTLMLIDTKPEEVNSEEIPEEEPVIDDIEVDEAIDGTDAQIEDAKKDSIEKGLYSEDEEELETPEERFDFIVLPKTFDEINKLNPRYGEELTPDHQAILDYLMNCLIEVNPEAAEELAEKRDDESNQEDLPINTDDIDVGIDIDREEDLENED